MLSPDFVILTAIAYVGFLFVLAYVSDARAKRGARRHNTRNTAFHRWSKFYGEVRYLRIDELTNCNNVFNVNP